MSKKLFRSLFILIIFQILLGFSSHATHMMGSDFTWTCVGQDSFLIKLVIYRDCNGVQLGAASIPFKCASSGASITTLSIAKPAPVDITPTCPNYGCTRCQSTSCSFPYGVEKYVFEKLVVLSNAGSCCNVIMSYTMCCRNSSITTGAANANYYIDAELNRCLSPCDNSPDFSIDPIILMCIGNDFIQSMGAINLDTFNGELIDSLSYEWTQPLANSSSSIAYSGQYSYDKPIYFYDFPDTSSAFPKGLHLNKSSGELKFRPSKIEQTVFALKVNQWRKINGNFTNIGYTRRDIQIIVISCSPNETPLISGEPDIKYACEGDTITFQFNTVDSNLNDTVSIYYNNALPGATWSTTNGQSKRPIGTLTWGVPPGFSGFLPLSFTITVRDNVCPIVGSFSKDFRIYINCGNNNNQPRVQDLGSGEFHFYATGDTTNRTFEWEGLFNPGFNFSGPSANFKFNYGGKYPYRFTINPDSSNEINIIDTIYVYPLSEGFEKTDIKCYGNNSGSAKLLLNGGKNPFHFIWSSGDTLQTAKNLTKGFYTVLATDASGMKVLDTVEILQPLQLSYSFDSLKHVSCWNENNGFALVNVDHGTPPYYFNWSNGDSTNFSTKLKAGTFKVTIQDNCNFIITDSVTILEPIKIKSEIEQFNNVRCKGENSGHIKIKTSGGNYPYYYFWSGGNTTNEISNLSQGSYILKTTDMASCVVSDTFYITEPDTFTLEATVVHQISCSGSKNGKAEIVQSSGGTAPFIYIWTNGDSSTYIEEMGPGSYTVFGIDSCGNVAYDSVVFYDGPFVVAESITGSSQATLNSLKIYSVNDNPAYSFLWQVTNGSIYAGQGSKSIAVEWDNIGNGLVELIVSKDQRCYDTSSLAVHVVLSIENQFDENKIQIYPNPVKDKLYINMDNFVQGRKFKLEIIDSYGRILHVEEILRSNNSVSVLELPSGMYLLKITDSNNLNRILKFSKVE